MPRNLKMFRLWVSGQAHFIRSPQKSVQHGWGLVEVMISVFILAVGILGLATMQLAAKRLIFEAAQRSLATDLSRDILERIRSNPGELSRYIARVNNMLLDRPTAFLGANCSKTECSSAELADYDIWDWSQEIQGDRVRSAGKAAGGLFHPAACMHARDGQVTVVVAWRGVTEFDQTTLEDPGSQGLGECGEGQFSTGDRLRRQLTMTTFIADR
ncbi:MAG: type IV pilus modification protein PilV [Halioglobus sp.]